MSGVSANTRVLLLALPQLSRAEVARLNRVNRWRAPLPLPGNESFSLQLLDAGAPAPPRDERLRLLFSVGEDQFEADLPRPLMVDLIHSIENRLRLDPLPPPDLAALLLESALLPLVDAMERKMGKPVTLDTLTEADERAVPNMRSILLSGTRLHQILGIGGMSDGLERLLGGWRSGSRPLNGMPIPVRLFYGSTVLTVRLLRSLRVGDAVLLQHSETVLTQDGTASAAALHVADSLGATVRRIGSGWRLEAPVRSLDWTGQDVSENGSSADDHRIGQGIPEPRISDPRTLAETHLDELPVRLQFEAGRLELSLGMLRGLGAGSVLEFDGEPGQVAILSGGRRIGSGSLVSIEGRPGVQIDSFVDGLDAGSSA